MTYRFREEEHMIKPWIDATGTLRPTPMELYAAERQALDAEQPPEGGCSQSETTPPEGLTQEAGKLGY
jgi:hypothetical protein